MKKTVLRLGALICLLAALTCGVQAYDQWWDPLAVEQQVYTYLTEELGLNSAAACGVLANIEYESAFQVTIVGDQGTSYGLFQWHEGRYTALRSFCAAQGLDYRTVEGQLSYLSYELKSSYPNLFGSLRAVENSAEGAYIAAYQWCIQFERPADMEKKAAIRGNSAKYKYWNRYNSLSLVPLEEPYLEPEEVIQELQEEPGQIDLPRQVYVPDREDEAVRRYIPEKPEKRYHQSWHSPRPTPEGTGANGFALGMLFAWTGDGRKYGPRIPEPEVTDLLDEEEEFTLEMGEV